MNYQIKHQDVRIRLLREYNTFFNQHNAKLNSGKNIRKEHLYFLEISHLL